MVTKEKNLTLGMFYFCQISVVIISEKHLQGTYFHAKYMIGKFFANKTNNV